MQLESVSIQIRREAFAVGRQVGSAQANLKHPIGLTGA
jgi:hypothetical protein